MPVWSENPWGTGIKGLTQLVYDEGVWALVGAPDGPSAHLAAQVVAKARLVFLSPVATDNTANLANVPWIFSCAPGDHLTAPLLARALLASMNDNNLSRTAGFSPRGGAVPNHARSESENPRGLKPAAHQQPAGTSSNNGGSFAVVSCTDHDSRMFATELLAALKRLETFPALHLNFQPDTAQFDTQLDLLQKAQPAAIALLGGPRDAARFLVALRSRGLAIPVFGDPRMGHRLLLETAGPAADGETFPLLWSPKDDDRTAEFTSRFKDHCGFEPDYTAAHTYDAVNLMITAIHRAGLNRARIRDSVRELSPWSGVTGPITWDPTGQNHRAVRLRTVRNARLIVADH
jgi:ABC-type branched-subunit amino acid transport system substrate-binding protein